MARIYITGMVQGVGFRPFVAGLADELGIRGYVRNAGGSVEIEALAPEDVLREFVSRIQSEPPAGSVILNIMTGYPEVQIGSGTVSGTENKTNPGSEETTGFRIVSSTGLSESPDLLPVIPPDIGICSECVKELTDINNRRHDYPLISCALCGPRYSIIRHIPYDRDNTTMKHYAFCTRCDREYRGVFADAMRRRHAQTISCHDCGPAIITHGSLPGIMGIKGVGGWQLAVSAFDAEALRKLRQIKGRETKPFAVMFPDITCIRKYCQVSAEEERLIASSARPIVLLEPSGSDAFPEEVCSGRRRIGAFIPSAGIYVMLTLKFGPLVVTSANISGSPMITDDEEFMSVFDTDFVWGYDRKIIRPLDDSVMQVVNSDIPQYIRRARGYVPLPVMLKRPLPEGETILAFGGDLKHAFAAGKGDKVVLSAPFGDLDDEKVYETAVRELDDMLDLMNAVPTKIVCDMHPGYRSVKMAERYAREHGLGEPVKIEHHHAHAASVMAEYDLASCIGVVFDGTGYGTDGHIWGGEILYCHDGSFERMAHLKEFGLAGGDEAAADTAKTAACLLHDIGMDIPDNLLDGSDAAVVTAALEYNINTSVSSSAGRRFDAVSAILGLCRRNSYEGEAAGLLQDAAERYLHTKHGPIRENDDAGRLAYFFHDDLTDNVKEACIRIRRATGENAVTLSGGCFHNALLLRLCMEKLLSEGFKVCINRQVSPGDGGLALGQIGVIAQRSASLQ